MSIDSTHGSIVALSTGVRTPVQRGKGSVARTQGLSMPCTPVQRGGRERGKTDGSHSGVM